LQRRRRRRRRVGAPRRSIQDFIPDGVKRRNFVFRGRTKARRTGKGPRQGRERVGAGRRGRMGRKNDGRDREPRDRRRKERAGEAAIF